MATILFEDTFEPGTFDPSNPASNYFFFQVPGVVSGNDGAASIAANTLTIDSNTFSFSNSTGLDHVKYLTFTKQAFPTPTQSKFLVVEATMSAQQTNLGTIPAALNAAPGSTDGIVDPDSDPRPCCGALNFVDFANLLVLDFIITNKMVYALYERLPFNRLEWGGPGPNYSAFTHIIPVFKRSSPTDFHKLQIAYSKKLALANWYVDDKLVFSVPNTGTMIDAKFRILEGNVPESQKAQQPIIRSNSFNAGFGTFSLMDARYPLSKDYSPNKGLVDLTLGSASHQILPFVDSNDFTINGRDILPRRQKFIQSYAEAGNSTNYGQGAVIQVKDFKVFTSNPF